MKIQYTPQTEKYFRLYYTPHCLEQDYSYTAASLPPRDLLDRTERASPGDATPV